MNGTPHCSVFPMTALVRRGGVRAALVLLVFFGFGMLPARATEALLLSTLEYYQAHQPRVKTTDYALYLQAPTAKLRVLQLRIRTSSAGVTTRYPSPDEAEALAAGGVMPLGNFSEPPNALQVDLLAYPEHAPLAETPRAWRWAHKGRLPKPGGAIVLSLEAGGWLPWRTRFRAQVVDDTAALQSDAAEFLLKTQNRVQAAAQLLGIESRQGLSAEAAFALSKTLHELDLDTNRRLEKLANSGGPLRSQARLYLAEEALLLGNANPAKRWFQGIGSDLPSATQPEYTALALSLGLGPGVDELDDSTLGLGPVALAAFNLATRTSNPANRLLLDRLGQLTMQDPCGWAVRDQANLVLGYWHLRNQQPAEAETAFSRIRLTGPAANAGRLGLGWAQISPGHSNPGSAPQLPQELGQLLRPREGDALAEARRSTPFRTAHGVANGALEERLQRALIPWTEMIGADPLDPSVQEAMLAIPYALTHLGAHEDALQRLNDSTSALQTLASHLRAAQNREDLGSTLVDGQQNGWEGWTPGITRTGGSRWWRQSQLPETFYLERLLQSGSLNTDLSHCTDLDNAIQLLNTLATNRDDNQREALLSALTVAKSACRQRVQQTALSILTEWASTVDKYLAESRLALARLHDVTPAAVAFANRR